VALQSSSGALLATLLAFTLELLVVVGLAVFVFTALAAQPGGPDLIMQLTSKLQDPTLLQDAGMLSSLARSPVVLAGVLLVAAVAIPLIEEAVKTIGVPIRAYCKPSLAEAVLWGVAGGAGFALAEGLFNSVGGLDSWAPVALMRAAATLLHCFTGGLMGLAWYSTIAERRWVRTFGLYIVCAGFHGLWNGLTAVLVFVSVSALETEASEADLMLIGAGSMAILGVLVLLALASGLGLLGLTLFARKLRRAPDDNRARPAPLLTSADRGEDGAVEGV
jgi:RsiW-degrading membrane proteinase PrsW (M82 family)